MSTWADFDPLAILRTLDGCEVDFVVIGGIAAVLHGSPRVTQDLDICFSTDDGNLVALGSALQSLDARLSGVTEDVPFVPDAATLRRITVLTLETVHGRLDVLAAPPGAPDYASLRANAARYDVDDVNVLVASLEDLIAMKRRVGRPRDLADIAELRSIIERRSLDDE